MNPFLTMIAIQICDGLLTWAGLTVAGLEMEGNAIIRGFMYNFGIIPVLIGFKGLGIALTVVCGIVASVYNIKWFYTAMLLACLYYMYAAIYRWVEFLV